MKKCEFYSFMMKDRRPAAVSQKGYTDGHFNYYRSPAGSWYAIVPEVGLSAGGAEPTRKQAAERAHQMRDAIKKRLETPAGNDMRLRWENALRAAEGGAEI